MRLSKEKKEAMEQYTLEIIDKGYENIAQHIAEVFSVDRSTAFRCISRLTEQEKIQKIRRGQYALLQQRWDFVLERKKGDLDSDITVYENYLEPHIRHLSDNILDIWSYVFTEMINNVIDHSESETAFISVRQDYLNTSVYIIDEGIGIFEKIKKHFGFSSVDESIEELFKGKLTTDTVNHSGEGIFFSSRLMDEFAIISGGRLFTCNHFDDERIADFSKEMMLPGTCVFMKLSNYSSKRTKEIFDAYSDEEGNFIRTRIPLKNIFDSSPVSRSQAKRLMHRFGEFSEVILDFEGIEWMGQGFADQLFRVFRQEHPAINLLPVNMNPDVAKMYRHVAL